ncbi:hypothetical protein COC60_11020 [Bacillus thuringiensis]|nr:hypothetical protein CN928_27810 [Bacillus thuringiensis]PGM36757.1 hypothetical protein CN945_04650 [Bacillus thuringiensis]PGP91877.1 hypothetical protein COA12_01320 [Bacillus thuringiensis]PGR67585.1 hypothetical protein COC60_11020 [Bacillus thuringiensis]
MKLYQRFFEYIYHNLQYINDFSNISIKTHNISTIFKIYLSKLTIYQRFNKKYRFTDKNRYPFLNRHLPTR